MRASRLLIASLLVFTLSAKSAMGQAACPPDTSSSEYQIQVSSVEAQTAFSEVNPLGYCNATRQILSELDGQAAAFRACGDRLSAARINQKRSMMLQIGKRVFRDLLAHLLAMSPPPVDGNPNGVNITCF